MKEKAGKFTLNIIMIVWVELCNLVVLSFYFDIGIIQWPFIIVIRMERLVATEEIAQGNVTKQLQGIEKTAMENVLQTLCVWG